MTSEDEAAAAWANSDEMERRADDLEREANELRREVRRLRSMHPWRPSANLVEALNKALDDAEKVKP